LVNLEVFPHSPHFGFMFSAGFTWESAGLGAGTILFFLLIMGYYPTSGYIKGATHVGSASQLHFSD
jgi:hypothetical protein